MRVLMVASELFPLVKTGGLADVVGALATCFAEQGIDVRVLVPGYPEVLDADCGWRAVVPVSDLPGMDGSLYGRILMSRDHLPARILALDIPAFFDRTGNPYLHPDGHDWPDNPIRFAALSYAAALIAGRRLLRSGSGAWVPDIVHANDWQTGLVPAYLRFAMPGATDPAPKPTVFTIHNMAFQGVFDPTLLSRLRLPAESFTPDGLEFHGRISFLKAGIRYADRISTVSPTYAEEIRRPEAGFGLEGLLEARKDALSGILNGIDTKVWNPADDPELVAGYDSRRIAGKAKNKESLQREFGLAERPDAPLFAIVSRLTWQKGMDLVLGALPRLIAAGGQLAILGSGERALEAAFLGSMTAHPGMVAVRIGFDEGLSHRIQAGADALLVPSRFEPCGLTQMYALRYGTIPVVRKAGGLSDTVVHASPDAIEAGTSTGVVFEDADVNGLAWAIEATAALYRQPPVWRKLQRTAMGKDNGWERSAKAYRALYADLLKDRSICDEPLDDELLDGDDRRA